MTQTQEAFFAILRGGLWCEAAQLPFQPSLDEWKEMHLMARQQAVTGIFYHGMLQLPAENRAPSAVMIALTAEIERIEYFNDRNTAVQEHLCSFCRKLGLHPLILKGNTLGAYYENPRYRMSGDIDIAFPKEEEMERFLQAIHERGITTTESPDKAQTYMYQGVAIEVHPQVFDLIRKSTERKILDGMNVDENSFRLPPEEELLMLSLHILKHGFSSGIGMKQLCDAAKAFAALRERIDSQKLLQLIEVTSTKRWSLLLHAMLTNRLGLTDTYDILKPVSERPLLRIVLRGGNFGFHTGWRQRVLKERAWIRKIDTVRAFFVHLPFALRFAPGHLLRYTTALVFGNRLIKYKNNNNKNRK